MGRTACRYYRTAEGLFVRWADVLVADARGIADYYCRQFGAGTREIPYGPRQTRVRIGWRSSG